MALKEILSPERKRILERREDTRSQTKALLKSDIGNRSTLLTPDGSADITDAAQQAGRPLSRQEIMRRLKRINPVLHYETSLNYPEKGGIYAIENRPDPITGRPPWKRFVCGIPSGMVSEFSVVETSREDVPDPDIDLHWQNLPKIEHKIPGWRVVLLKLILEGLIQPSDAEREFQITKGRPSQKWQAATNS